MTYPVDALRDHPGANPSRVDGGAAYRAYETRRIDGRPITFLTIRDTSRWIPHQGEMEKARRRRHLT